GTLPDSFGVARGAESAEDLTADRIVPVAESAAAGHRVHPERASAQHLVLGAEEDLRILLVGERGEARVGREVGRGPLPHVADELVDAERRRAVRIAAGRGGLEMALSEVRVSRSRIGVAPRVAAGAVGGGV